MRDLLDVQRRYRNPRPDLRQGAKTVRSSFAMHRLLPRARTGASRRYWTFTATGIAAWSRAGRPGRRPGRAFDVLLSNPHPDGRTRWRLPSALGSVLGAAPSAAGWDGRAEPHREIGGARWISPDRVALRPRGPDAGSFSSTAISSGYRLEAPRAPPGVAQGQGRGDVLDGAGNVAGNNIVSLGGNAALVGLLGSDPAADTSPRYRRAHARDCRPPRRDPEAPVNYKICQGWPRSAGGLTDDAFVFMVPDNTV